VARNPAAALLLGATLAGLQACATPAPMAYGPISETVPHGYRDRPNRDGGHTVLVVAPPHTPVQEARAFWDRRAAELCPAGVAKAIVFRTDRKEIMAPAGYVQGGAGFSSRTPQAHEIEGYVYCKNGAPSAG
jgi:hypothetical protein